MKLNKYHYEILEHRLSCYDGIVDALTDNEDYNVTQTQVGEAIQSVARMVEGRELPLENLTRIESLIVVDCLDGCTYFAGSEDAVVLQEISRSQLRAMHRAADELEEAVSQVVGQRVNCTRH